MEKQQSFIPTQQQADALAIFIDGAARGNPGPAGAGICITKDGTCLLRQGFYLNKKTNNQAEYLALVLALLLVRKLTKELNINPFSLTIVSDSELLVKQMKGIYAVKNETLLSFKTISQQLLHGIPHRFHHVLRAKNKIADQLANDGIDKKNKIASDLLIFLSNHNILV